MQIKKRAIYIMSIQEFGYYKIGYSNDPIKRHLNISTSIPFDIDILFLAYINQASGIESSLHYRYREDRVNGEWFFLSNEHLIEAITIIMSYNKFKILRNMDLNDEYIINKKWFDKFKQNNDLSWLKDHEINAINRMKDIGDIK